MARLRCLLGAARAGFRIASSPELLPSPASTPARDDALRGKACNTAFPRQPLVAEPIRRSRSVRAVEPRRNLHTRSREPESLGADTVQVREDRRYRVGVAG